VSGSSAMRDHDAPVLRFDDVDPRSRGIDLSVVVPVYNEAENIPALHSALTEALADLELEYEIVIVDDGSDDGSREILRALSRWDPHLRTVLFRRNAGQTPALAAGFDVARGRTIVTMDGDLQNDPADIPRLLQWIDRGYDVVCGWRRFRKDALATRLLPSRAANLLIRWSTGVPIHDTGCSLKAYRSWVVRSLELYSDMHRFIAALGAGVGARIMEIPVRHHPRRFGRSKYGLGRIFKVAADLIVIKMLIQFAAHPIRWFGLLSLPLLVLGLGFLVVAVVDTGSIDREVPFNVVAATAGIVALTIGFNVFLLGFLAELQLEVSRLFTRRISVVSTEAAS
jgi:glycosyltransferase involved in cell wall biosynthesis